jgi:hypothetical protein
MHFSFISLFSYYWPLYFLHEEAKYSFFARYTADQYCSMYDLMAKTFKGGNILLKKLRLTHGIRDILEQVFELHWQARSKYLSTVTTAKATLNFGGVRNKFRIIFVCSLLCLRYETGNRNRRKITYLCIPR